MKRAAVYLLLGVVIGAGAVTSAQSQLMPFREKYSAQYPPIPVGPFKTPDPFEGKWEIDKEQSTSYPKIENIVIKVTGDVQDYKNDIANEAGATRHQGYENRFNEMLWVPYMRANVGKPFQYVMTVKGDDRTHYRFIRNLDGSFGGIMVRRLAADGKSYVSVGFSPDGNVIFKRAFKKVDSFTHTTATEDMTCKRPNAVIRSRKAWLSGRRSVVAAADRQRRGATMDRSHGKPPASLKPGEGFSIPVHKIARSPDGLLYVCDRRNNRVQEFELVPGGVRYRREVYVAPGSIGMGSAADVAFTPDNRFMFVSDMMGMRVWTVDRKTFDVLGWTNAAPEHEGDDNIAVAKIPVHRMALLPNGDLLLTRTRRGIQRLRFIGVS